MKIRIRKKLNEGSFTDALDKMIGSDADSISGSNTVPPKGPTRRSPPPREKLNTNLYLRRKVSISVILLNLEAACMVVFSKLSTQKETKLLSR